MFESDHSDIFESAPGLDERFLLVVLQNLVSNTCLFLSKWKMKWFSLVQFNPVWSSLVQFRNSILELMKIVVIVF